MWNVQLGYYLKLQLRDAIYRLRFYSNSLTHTLSLSNSHNVVASRQKNRGDKSHHVIVALHNSNDHRFQYISAANSWTAIMGIQIANMANMGGDNGA